MVRKQLGIMALAVMVVAFVAAARATDLTLSNSGFQTDAVADGEPSTTTPTDWNPAPGTTGTGVVWNPTSSSFLGANGNGSLPSPAAGSQCLWVTGEPNLYQLYGMLVSPIQANKVYTLTAAVGAPLDRDFGYFGIYMAGATLSGNYLEVASNSGSTGIEDRSGLFYDKSASFNTGPGGSTGAVGRYLVVTLGGDRAAYDNIRLTVSDVPEPGAVMLLTTGTLVGLLACVWRRVRNRIR